MNSNICHRVFQSNKKNKKGLNKEKQTKTTFPDLLSKLVPPHFRENKATSQSSCEATKKAEICKSGVILLPLR